MKNDDNDTSGMKVNPGPVQDHPPVPDGDVCPICGGTLISGYGMCGGGLGGYKSCEKCHFFAKDQDEAAVAPPPLAIVREPKDEEETSRSPTEPGPPSEAHRDIAARLELSCRISVGYLRSFDDFSIPDGGTIPPVNLDTLNQLGLVRWLDGGAGIRLNEDGIKVSDALEAMKDPSHDKGRRRRG